MSQNKQEKRKIIEYLKRPMKMHLRIIPKRKDKEDSYVHKNINEQVNKNEQKEGTLHGKPENISEKLNFNSE